MSTGTMGQREPDMSWIDIAVGRKMCVILDYSEGWRPYIDELHFEDVFDCDPPSHLPIGAYRWSGFKVGSWDEGDAVSVFGGTFAPRLAHSDETAGLVELLKEAAAAMEPSGACNGNGAIYRKIVTALASGASSNVM